MSTKFLHTPHHIVQQLLLNRALGSQAALTFWQSHTDASDDQNGTYDWPVFRSTEPGTPDNCIVVYSTTPQVDAKIMVTGEVQKHYGIMIKVRGRTDDVAGLKAINIEHDLNEAAFDQTVTIDGRQYLVQSFPRVTVTPGYRESPTSTRWYYSLNCLAVILAHPIQG